MFALHQCQSKCLEMAQEVSRSAAGDVATRGRGWLRNETTGKEEAAREKGRKGRKNGGKSEGSCRHRCYLQPHLLSAEKAALESPARRGKARLLDGASRRWSGRLGAGTVAEAAFRTRGRRGRLLCAAHATRTVAPGAAGAAGAALGAEALDLFPLLGGELAADGEQVARVGFFELGAGLGNFVDLGEDFGLVGLLVADERGELKLCFLEIGAEVNEGFAMLEEDGIELLLLRIGKVEAGGDPGVIPPVAHDAVAVEGMFKGGPVTVESPALPHVGTVAGTWALRQGRTGNQKGGNRQ